MLRIAIRTLVVAASSVFAAGAALACPPPPPPPQPPQVNPGESPLSHSGRVAQWQAEQTWLKTLEMVRTESWADGFENGLWIASEQIVLVEVVAIGTTELRNDIGEVYGTSPETTVRVIRAVRGAAKPQQFKLRYVGTTSCGPIGPISLLAGKPGDRFVVFARRGPLGMSTYLGSYGANDTDDGRTRQLLAWQPLGAQPE